VIKGKGWLTVKKLVKVKLISINKTDQKRGNFIIFDLLWKMPNNTIIRLANISK
jgi:hypothetical protein